MNIKSILVLYLIIVSFFDLFYGQIPNFITLIFFALLLLSDIFTAPSKISVQLLYAVVFFLMFLCIALLTKGLGLGDVKLAAVIGYCKGFFDTSLIFILACFAGLFFFLSGYFLKKEIKKIPFAPFVTVGYFLSEIFCRRLL